MEVFFDRELKRVTRALRRFIHLVALLSDGFMQGLLPEANQGMGEDCC